MPSNDACSAGQAGNGDPYDRSRDRLGDQAKASGDGDWENRRIAALQRYQGFFTKAALVGVGISLAGIVVGFFLSDAAQAVVFATFGAGGLLIAAMALVIRMRIRTGPKVR